MSRQRVRYLNAKPAFGNAASDVALHNQLKGIIRGEHDQSDEGLSSLFGYVASRLAQTPEADYPKREWGWTSRQSSIKTSVLQVEG